MSKGLLGNTFDIHGGGRDLIFPHHENEIAQSEGANGCEFARYWMHNGTLDIGSEKMSKSLGNYFTVHDVLKSYDPEVVRYFLLSANYRSPLNYTTQALDDAKKALDRIYETTARVENPPPPLRGEGQVVGDHVVHSWLQKFQDALDDDFNTPKAYAVIFDAVRDVNRELDSKNSDSAMLVAWPLFLKTVSGVLGFAGSTVAEYVSRQARLVTQKTGVSPTQIEKLLADRKAARAAKNFKKSDEIRDQLTTMGVTIKDRPDGTTEWKLN
jgi:cysteinyl-tRNA synthetase